MKNRYAYPVLFLIAGLCLLFLSSCQDRPRNEYVLKIGVIADDYLDGYYHSLNGIELALDQYNAEGGILLNGRRVRVELVREQIKHNPEKAVSSIRKLINTDQVNAVIGPQYSLDAIPASDVAERTGIPMISPMSTSPDVTAGRQWIFRMSFVDPVQGRAMAKAALNDFNAERAAILYNKAEPYSSGLARVFEQEFSRKGRVVATQNYVTGDVDFSSQLGRIQRANPDVLYLPVLTEDLALIAQQIGGIDLKSKILGSDGWNQHRAPRIEALEGAFYTSHWSELMVSEKTRDFIERYRKRFQVTPISTSALSYDAFGIILDAVRLKQAIDPDSIRDGLVVLGPYHGVGGIVDFISDGDPVKSVVLLQIRDGRNILHSVIE